MSDLTVNRIAAAAGLPPVIPGGGGGGVDAAALAQQLGIDITGAGQGDPFGIFLGGLRTGEEQVRTGSTGALFRPGGGTTTVSRLASAVGIPSGTTTVDRLGAAVGVPGAVAVQQVGEVLKQFYQLDTTLLRRVQALLYAGGFYGDIDVTDIRFGEYDEASFSAWAQAIARAARLNAAGEDVTLQQVIGEAGFAAGIDPVELNEALATGDEDDIEALLNGLAGGSRQGRVIDIQLSDPNALRSTIDQASSAILGRRANPAEQRMFISMMHGLERSQAIARQTAEPGEVSIGTDPSAFGFDDELIGPTDAATETGQPFARPGDSQLDLVGAGGPVGPGDVPGGEPGVVDTAGVTGVAPGDVTVETAAPDAGATAEALIRQQNPEEAGAHDIALQFANFLQLLPAPVNVPRVTAGGGP